MNPYMRYERCRRCRLADDGAEFMARRMLAAMDAEAARPHDFLCVIIDAVSRARELTTAHTSGGRARRAMFCEFEQFLYSVMGEVTGDSCSPAAADMLREFLEKVKSC